LAFHDLRLGPLCLDVIGKGILMIENKMLRGGLTALVALALGTAVLQAAEVERHALGSTLLEVVETDDMSKELRHGGQVLISDYMLLLDEPMVIDGVPLRVGSVSAGGNVCGGERFVVWQQGQDVKLARTDDPCSYPQPEIEDGKLILKAPAVPGTPGQVWAFDPTKGLVAQQPVVFAPDRSLGWGDILDLEQPTHPMDVLAIGAVYDQLQAGMAPQDFDVLTATLAELGSGEHPAEGYAGHACYKMECEERFAYLWVDDAKQQAYVIWADGENMQLWPQPMEDWPEWIVRDASAVLGIN